MSTLAWQTSNIQIAALSLALLLVAVIIRKPASRVLQAFASRTFAYTVVFVIQIPLLVFCAAYRDTLIIFAFLFLTGLNLYLLFTPSFLRLGTYSLFLIPVFGLALISVAGSYLIAFNIPISQIGPLMAGFSVLTLGLQLKLNNEACKRMFAEWRQISRSEWTLGISLSTIAVLILIYPVAFIPYATSTFRIGPDMALYAKMTQFFLDGGTWAQAQLRAGEFAGMSPGDINRYSDAIMSWPELYYFRWGLTSYQTAAASITFTNHSYETAFVSMATPHLLLGAAVLVWTRERFAMSMSACIAGAFAFLFNSNLLNLWFEGFYGNSFVLVFFTLILFQFEHQRSHPYARRDYMSAVGFLTLLIATSLTAYPEAIFFVLIPFAGFIFATDLIYNREIKWSSYLLLLLGGIASLVVLLPCRFLIQWFTLAFQQLINEGGNGYVQPHWAFPNEMLGFQNIYLNISVKLVDALLARSFADQLVLILFCAVIGVLVLYFLWKEKSKGNAVFLASVLMVAAAAWYVSEKSPQNNYTYMKMYVFHLSFLFILFWGSVQNFVKNISTRFSVTADWIYWLAAMPIIASGLVYIIQYRADAHPVEAQKMAIQETVRPLLPSHTIIYPSFLGQGHRIADILHRQVYAAILPVPWIIRDRWEGGQFFTKFMNDQVFLFFEKRAGYEYDYPEPNLVFENEWLLVVKSGKVVKDALNSDMTSFNFDVYARDVVVQPDAQRQAHNLSVGLPADFDPAVYLQVNPDLQEFWESRGIHETGQALMDRAEVHYRDFGRRDNWRYK